MFGSGNGMVKVMLMLGFVKLSSIHLNLNNFLMGCDKLILQVATKCSNFATPGLLIELDLEVRKFQVKNQKFDVEFKRHFS